MLCAGFPTPHTRRRLGLRDRRDLRSGIRQGRETCAERVVDLRVRQPFQVEAGALTKPDWRGWRTENDHER